MEKQSRRLAIKAEGPVRPRTCYSPMYETRPAKCHNFRPSAGRARDFRMAGCWEGEFRRLLLSSPTPCPTNRPTLASLPTSQACNIGPGSHATRKLGFRFIHRYRLRGGGGGGGGGGSIKKRGLGNARARTWQRNNRAITYLQKSGLCTRKRPHC